jgi:hypothetical protein
LHSRNPFNKPKPAEKEPIIIDFGRVDLKYFQKGKYPMGDRNKPERIIIAGLAIIAGFSLSYWSANYWNNQADFSSSGDGGLMILGYFLICIFQPFITGVTAPILFLATVIIFPGYRRELTLRKTFEWSLIIMASGLILSLIVSLIWYLL